MSPTLIGVGKVRYSSIRASNSKYILLEQNDGFIHLYGADGKFIRVLPRALRTDTQVMFSRVNPDVLHYVDLNDVMAYNIPLNGHQMVREFPEYVGFMPGPAEGDVTEAGYIALAGILPDSRIEVLSYSVSMNDLPTKYPQDEIFDGIKMMGSHLILSKDSGIWDLTSGKQLTTVNGHACPYSNGLLWCSAADAKVNQNAVCLIDDSGIHVLKSFSWAYAMHITAGPDFAGVSVYDPTGLLPFQIWQVPFDGSGGTLIHEWKSIYRGYDSSPKASYSNGRILYNVDDGIKVSVWGLDVGLSVKFTPPPPALVPTRTRIDYSSYVGKSRFILEPRADGAVDIFEEKL